MRSAAGRRRMRSWIYNGPGGREEYRLDVRGHLIRDPSSQSVKQNQPQLPFDPLTLSNNPVQVHVPEDQAGPGSPPGDGLIGTFAPADLGEGVLFDSLLSAEWFSQAPADAASPMRDFLWHRPLGFGEWEDELLGR
jgi:hypothetical protein